MNVGMPNDIVMTLPMQTALTPMRIMEVPGPRGSRLCVCASPVASSA